MDNLEIWNKLGKTDPKHTKPFSRSGGFKGTAIKPMFSYHRMTEEFGPCGIGWGVNQPIFQVVPGENKEVLVYCTVSIWHGDKTNVVYGVGGDKAVSYIAENKEYKRPERWVSDDEAFKKAFTDAVTNALKLIGVGADVHMGMFDDSKYVNSMKAEFHDDETKPVAKAETVRPMMGPEFIALQKEIQEASTQEALNVARDKCTAAKERMTPQQAKTLGAAITATGAKLIPTGKQYAEAAE